MISMARGTKKLPIQNIIDASATQDITLSKNCAKN